MKKRDLERHLASQGCRLIREGANHEMWENPTTRDRNAITGRQLDLVQGAGGKEGELRVLLAKDERAVREGARSAAVGADDDLAARKHLKAIGAEGIRYLDVEAGLLHDLAP